MTKLTSEQNRFFEQSSDIHIASAPGRLDVMGGIADYSGSYVLQMPIAQRTTVYVSKRSDGVLRVCSPDVHDDLQPTVTISMDEIVAGRKVLNPQKLITRFSRSPKTSWVLYILGCVFRLLETQHVSCAGLDIWVASQVPIGKGVSSSAAIEVATLKALCSAFSITMPGSDLPSLAQDVENNFVGAPCGIMDQLAVYHGKKNRLLPIRCRPGEIEPLMPIPAGITFVGIDSGKSHRVSGVSYTDVRTAAFMGYSIIAESVLSTPAPLKLFRRSGDRSAIPYTGYLSAITPSEFEERFRALLPARMTGEEFNSRGLISIDTCTSPSNDSTYFIQACTQHPVYENYRVQLFRHLLRSLSKTTLSRADRKSILVSLGELMYQSHESYSRCGLGSETTDALVMAGKRYGPENGIYGARITGGGSGGTVCFLCASEKGIRSIKKIAQDHVNTLGTGGEIFLHRSNRAKSSKTKGSSPSF